MKLAITARENCEYNSDLIDKIDNFMTEDCLCFTFVNQRNWTKLLFFAKVTIGQIDMKVRKILLRNHKPCLICLNQGHNS